jgi:hypothetical protein
VTTAENVTVTDQSISGSGLFGNSGVTLEYGGIGTVNIFTGQMADTYTVKPSSPNAVFPTLGIYSISNWSFCVTVFVPSGSDLNLTVANENASKSASASKLAVYVSSTGSPESTGTYPVGDIYVFDEDGATSTIAYDGFLAKNVFWN